MTSVSITHNKDTKVTHIDVDGKRLERVRAYSLKQRPSLHPVVEIIQDDEHGIEFSRTFVPTELTLRAV